MKEDKKYIVEHHYITDGIVCYDHNDIGNCLDVCVKSLKGCWDESLYDIQYNKKSALACNENPLLSEYYIIREEKDPYKIIAIGRFYTNYFLLNQTKHPGFKLEFYKNGITKQTNFIFYETAERDLKICLKELKSTIL